MRPGSPRSSAPTSSNAATPGTSTPSGISCDDDILQMVYDSIQAGGHGVSIGRNVFQHRNVEGMTRAISDIVLRGYTVEEAKKDNLS